jgi:hypothetical protein
MFGRIQQLQAGSLLATQSAFGRASEGGEQVLGFTGRQGGAQGHREEQVADEVDVEAGEVRQGEALRPHRHGGRQADAAEVSR